MTVEHREGDLFAQDDVQALAHGVNCYGLMGAGIAVQFRNRWPAMYEQYRAHCQAELLRPGGMFMWDGLPDEDENFYIFNLASQDRPGADASIQWLTSSLIKMADAMIALRITTVGLPRIGAGIGGLAWEDVKATYETVDSAYEHYHLRFVVVSLPGA